MRLFIDEEIARIQVVIDQHTIVDESSPFPLYAIEVHSSFSKQVISKQIENFKLFHR